MTILIAQPDQQEDRSTATFVDDLVIDGGFVTPKDSAKDRGFVAPEINSFGNSFRDYDAETERQKTVEELYRLNHIHQTYDFVKTMREEYGKLDKIEMSIWECCELLNDVVDDSDPDLDEPQIEHLLQTAEAIRKDYPDQDWLHLTALIHDLGKVLLLPSFGGLPQWAVVGDTHVLGCAFDESIVHHKYFKENPDTQNPDYTTRCGIYQEGCGLNNVMISWGHDDYMYLVAKENKSTLPSAGLFIIRYHSFYPLHKSGAYTHLMNEEDRDNIKWLKIFNKYDLYSKSKVRVDVDKVKPYYLSLINKSFTWQSVFNSTTSSSSSLFSEQNKDAPLLGVGNKTGSSCGRVLFFVLAFFAGIAVGATVSGDLDNWFYREERANYSIIKEDDAIVIESQKGVVAADDGRCSKIGVSILKKGGHAVDAAVATAFCVGVVNPMASGIGGGSFLIVRSSETLKTEAYDTRETAPSAASEDMYANNPSAKYHGPLSMGVPGEIAGLHAAWLKHGKLAWKSLFEPSIKLAKEGFVVAPYLASYISQLQKMILGDPGLRQVFAPNRKLLRAGDMCYNKELGQSLELIAEHGPDVFYNGIVGENLIKDVREAGGILTKDDLKNYKVDVSEAMASTTMGYTIYGMQPPSSGTVGLSMVMNILDSYGNANAAKGNVGLHRLIEALKHMFAVRMNLGDPSFVNIDNYVSQMLSNSYAEHIREKILDNTAFPSEYYLYKWSQLRDHGTSHFCIVDSDRNAVSMTTTVNYPFGAGVLSPSTGIVLNNEMGDFSTPTEITPDTLPPAPPNFIRPNKRPLSSMTPLIVTKDGHLAGVIGGSGGMNIIPAVVQVFLNHFVLGMEPLSAVQNPRIYHRLIPNVVLYENLTCIDGDHIELADNSKLYLTQRGHQLEARAGGAIVQLIAQRFEEANLVDLGRKGGRVSINQVSRGILTAVSDPRKDGRPAAV